VEPAPRSGTRAATAASHGGPRSLRWTVSFELQAARRRIAREPGSRSSRRERATYGLIAELCARQSRRREDWLHKTTTNLAKSHGPIALEDLHVKNMTRSARGSMKQAGVNVRAKAGMNRSILGMAWGTVERMLAYKSQDCGGVLVKVPAARGCCSRVGLPPEPAPPQGMGWLDAEPSPLGGP